MELNESVNTPNDDVTPAINPDPAPEPTTDSAPDLTPDTAPDPATDSAPDLTPDPAPDPATDSAPDLAPDPATDSAPDLTLDPSPAPNPDMLSQVPRMTELAALYFAVELLDKAGYELLCVKDFVHINPGKELFEDFMTMTVLGKRFLVAFTDPGQIENAQGSSHHHMTSDVYLPIISGMPFDGIAVNPFDAAGRRIIDKFTIEKAYQQSHGVNISTDMSSENIAAEVKTAAQTKYDSEVAEIEQNTVRMTDEELTEIFTEFFAPNSDFFNLPGSDKHKAYFDAVNTATLEILNNPLIFSEATKREHSELTDMTNNRIPGKTNTLICGLIFCIGRYAVVPSALLCVDFSESIPNCIALYLLLTARKLPPDKRKQTIDAGDGTDTAPLSDAMASLRVCDPDWEYEIISSEV